MPHSQMHSFSPVCDTLALSAEGLLSVTCAQLDSVVGGMLGENKEQWLQREISFKLICFTANQMREKKKDTDGTVRKKTEF